MTRWRRSPARCRRALRHLRASITSNPVPLYAQAESRSSSSGKLNKRRRLDRRGRYPLDDPPVTGRRRRTPGGRPHDLPVGDSHGQRFAGTALESFDLLGGPDWHFAHYPGNGGKFLNLAAFRNDGAGEEVLGMPVGRDEELGQFPVLDETARRFLELGEEWKSWVLRDSDLVPDWVDGPVVLLGDAAHPMPQYAAQGGLCPSPHWRRRRPVVLIARTPRRNSGCHPRNRG